jgi:P-type Cu2+ transporter
MEKRHHDNHEHHHKHHGEHSSGHQTEKSNHDHGNHGHHDHHAMMIEDFKKRFWISLVLTIPVLALSHMIQQWLGFEFTFRGDQYVLFALSLVIFFHGGWPFLKGLREELKDKNPGMMTLIAVAITVAYVYSTAVVFGLEGMDFYWELATLIVIMLLGHWIEMKSVMGASKALELLAPTISAEKHS